MPIIIKLFIAAALVKIAEKRMKAAEKREARAGAKYEELISRLDHYSTLMSMLRAEEERHPTPTADIVPKPFKAVYHRYGDLRVAEFSDFEQARDFLQQSASAGELHGHGIYDANNKVAYYPEPNAYSSEREEQLREALGLETSPEVAGLYPVYSDDGEE